MPKGVYVRPYKMHPRTAQVLRLTALGYTGPQIAELMGIQKKSVNQYKAKFKRRWCQGANMSVLVGIALREKLVTVQELVYNAERYLHPDA